MSQEPKASLPQASFPISPLEGIKQVVWICYLRKFPAAQTTKRTQTLERIRGTEPLNSAQRR